MFQLSYSQLREFKSQHWKSHNCSERKANSLGTDYLIDWHKSAFRSFAYVRLIVELVC